MVKKKKNRTTPRFYVPECWQEASSILRSHKY